MHRAPDVHRPPWERIGEIVSSRRSWVLALVVAALGGALLGLIPQSGSAEQSPVVLPPNAESVRAAEVIKAFPGGDAAPVLLVISRADGADLSPEELDAAQQARDRMAGVTGVMAAPGPPIIGATDGKAAAVRGHYAATVPAAGQAAVRAALDQALEPADDDPANRVVTNLLRDLVAAMLDSGAIDAGLTIDTSAADATQPLPAVTLGMKVKDGAALEKKVKERLGKADALPPSVKVTFDAGKQGDATLHEITADISALPAAERLGDSVKLTLAVTPQYAYVLVGGDVPKRLAAALAAGGKPNGDALPIANVDLSLASLVGYAARMMQAFNPDDPQGDMLGEISKQAGEKDTTTVQFSVKPVDRGITLRLSADAGALQTVAASTAMQQAAPPPRARPLTPLRPAQPRQLENDDTPSITP